MYVTGLRYENYRNLEDGSISPSQGIHVIYGENAQGKTNLLEALWLFTGGHSFRGAKDAEIPRLMPKTGKNAEFCRLHLEFFSEERLQKAQLTIQNGKRSSVINGVEKKSGAALVGKVCAVIFSPEHLQLVKNGPSLRRNFVDGAICQMQPGYAKILSTYRRTLLQRNTLLKDIPRHSELLDTIDVWDMRLAKFGGSVMVRRAEYIRRLAPEIARIYQGISQNREMIDLTYEPSVEAPEQEQAAQQALYQALVKGRDTDLRAGHTATGPHRDDLRIQINGISARMYASQGQQRSAVLAMKLAEAQILFEKTTEAPIILLDDVMSELDAGRQDYLLNHLHDRQVFITCCAPETVRLLEQGKRYHVEDGTVQEV